MLTLVFALSACDPKPAASPPEAVATAPTTAAPAPAPAQAGAISGVVQESLAAGPYTYTRLKTADGTDVWAAATGTAPEMGSTVTVSTALPMSNFHSDTLERDFALVYFVESLGGAAAAPVATRPTLPTGHPVKAAGAPAGQRQVGDIWSERATLAGRQVTLTGDVVKFTSGVMGRNWLHVRDGSGGEGTNDLTVTSTDVVAIGDRVEATGTVSVDQDYGSGYSYPVILTESRLSVVGRAAP